MTPAKKKSYLLGDGFFMGAVILAMFSFIFFVATLIFSWILLVIFR